MSYYLFVLRGNGKHFAGRLEKLKPLDEDMVREVLRTPPAGFELLDGDAEEVRWAGEALLAQMLVVRTDDGVVRSVEAGLSGSGEGNYNAEFAAVAGRLLDLAESVRGRLYREVPDRTGRLDRDEIDRIASRPEPEEQSPPPESHAQLLVDSYELDDAQAEGNLVQHVARGSERLSDFRAEVAALGGPTDADLDGTAESLARLERWLADELPRRYDGLREPTPHEVSWGAGLVQMPATEWRRQWPDEPAELPPWCAPGAEEVLSPLPPTGLWLADGLGYYLVECLSRELGPLRWQVYRAASRRLRDVDENDPVVATSAGTFNAHSAAYSVVLKALAYRRREPGLVTIYEHALERLRGA